MVAALTTWPAVHPLLELDRAAPIMYALALQFAAGMLAVVAIERIVYGLNRIRRRRLEGRYGPIIRRALQGDGDAQRMLVKSPSRHRLTLARLLIEPLIDDRDPQRIAVTRTIVQGMAVLELADRYLRSPLWWRRALALRALGLLEARDRTAAVIAALDDPNAGVRAAAL